MSVMSAWVVRDIRDRENMRVLQWIVKRVNFGAWGKETPIGWVPRFEDLDWKGLDFPKENWEQLMKVDRSAWKMQTLTHEELYLELSDTYPRS